MVFVGHQLLFGYLHVAHFPVGEQVGGGHLVLLEVEMGVV